jgi:hypothetical protein
MGKTREGSAGEKKRWRMGGSGEKEDEGEKVQWYIMGQYKYHQHEHLSNRIQSSIPS